jgi:hypothetical protein
VTAEELLSRSLKLLQGAIRASGHTQTDIDDRIGRRRGYLSHVFQRRVDLKLIDLLRALAVLEIDPRRFFAAVTAAGAGASSGVLQLLADRIDWEAGQAAKPMAAVRPAAPATEAVLEERVKRALRSILAQMGERGVASGRG